jgi:protein-tyrosine-phosphatase
MKVKEVRHNPIGFTTNQSWNNYPRYNHGSYVPHYASEIEDDDIPCQDPIEEEMIASEDTIMDILLQFYEEIKDPRYADETNIEMTLQLIREELESVKDSVIKKQTNSLPIQYAKR